MRRHGVLSSGWPGQDVPCDPLQVAQTSIARLNAIVIRDDVADIRAFHLLADTASAGYWWDCLLDAGAEHDMGVVGLDALRNLNRS